MFFKSYMRKYILKYIVFISVFCVAFCSWSLPASAYWSDAQLTEFVSLENVNLYVYNGSSFMDGDYIHFDSFKISPYQDQGYVFDINISDSSSSDWVIDGYYNMRLIFDVSYYDYYLNTQSNPSESYKYDSFSCSLYGQWMEVNELKNKSDLFKIYRKIPDKLYADTFHWFTGDVDFGSRNSYTDSVVSYSLPVFDSLSYMSAPYTYQIIIDFSFKNDNSSSASRNYRFFLNPFMYTSGTDDTQLTIYPSFDDSALTDFEDKESAAVGSAMDSFNSVKDSVFDFSIIDQNTEAYKGYVAVSKLVSKFIDIPFVGNLVKFSVLFGVLALVVGIASNVIGRSKR